MENKFIVIDDKGLEVECETLFTFDNEDTGKSYIVYTDNSIDKEGNIQVYANIYDSKSKNIRLEAIETDAEWQVIETILDTLQDVARTYMN